MAPKTPEVDVVDVISAGAALPLTDLVATFQRGGMPEPEALAASRYEAFVRQVDAHREDFLLTALSKNCR